MTRPGTSLQPATSRTPPPASPPNCSASATTTWTSSPRPGPTTAAPPPWPGPRFPASAAAPTPAPSASSIGGSSRTGSSTATTRSATAPKKSATTPPACQRTPPRTKPLSRSPSPAPPPRPPRIPRPPDEGQPDAAQTIAATAPGGTANTTDTYNANGQLTGIATAKTGTTPPAATARRTIKYNAEAKSPPSPPAAAPPATLRRERQPAAADRPSATTLYADGGAEQITATGSTLSGIRLFGNSPDGGNDHRILQRHHQLPARQPAGHRDRIHRRRLAWPLPSLLRPMG